MAYIDPLPLPPSRDDPDNFSARGDAFMTALPTFQAQANALAASMTMIAAGGAFAIPYTFSTTTTDADPGAGFLCLDNATQNLATTVRLDLFGADATDWSAVLDTFDASTSVVKGQIRLVKLADASHWIIFNLTARATPSGYRNMTVAVVGSSTTNPFANNDSLVLQFTRTGDKGSASTAPTNFPLLSYLYANCGGM
jgi:hypothetical protein